MRTILLGLALLACLSCGPDSASEKVILAESRSVDQTIASNEVLVLREAVTFYSGASLILEPGASLRFEEDVTLHISGDLIALASSAGSIYVHSDGAEHMGVVRVDGSLASISHVLFDGMFVGLLCTSDSLQMDNTEFKNCDTGFWIQNSLSNLNDLKVKNCGLGARIESSKLLLQSSVFSNCSDIGIRLSGAGGTITNCQFTGNMWGINSIDSDTTRCEFNHFESNTYGIRYFYGDVRFTDNTCINNEMHIFLSAYPRHTVNMHRNNFFESDSSAVHILPRPWNNPHDVVIDNNYWNTTDHAEIAQRIYDGLDHQPCDVLIFDPIATAPF
jgi:hypothetical protein